MTDFPRCECGRVLTTSRQDAEEKAQAAADGYNRHPPIRFYECAYGTTHWAERYTAYQPCPCGHRAYHDTRAAVKAAERRNTKHQHPTIQARAYQCPHGGDHILLFPVDETVGHCRECGDVIYRNHHIASTLADYLNTQGTTRYTVTAPCRTHPVPHITREQT